MQYKKYYFLHNSIKKLLSEENKVPRMQYEARKVAGSTTYKQSNTVWNYVVL